MDYLKVNKLSKVPIYTQLKESIKAAILDGTLPELTELPREEEVRSLVDISRMVARRAYQELIDEGFARREKGKSPYIMRSMRFLLPMDRLPHTDEILAQGHTVTRKLIVADLLKDFIGDTYKIVMMTYADNIAIYRQNILLPAQLYPKLEKQDLTAGPIFDLIFKTYGKKSRDIRNFGSQRDLSRIDAKLFSLPEGSIGMLLETHILAADGEERLADIETLYPDERCRFVMDMRE